MSVRTLFLLFLLCHGGPAYTQQGILTLDRTSTSTIPVPLLYSALLQIGGGFLSQSSLDLRADKELRGEGQIGLGLPRLQGQSIYMEWDYDYLQHWLAVPSAHGNITMLQREHRISPTILFNLSSRWTLGLFGFYSWVYQGKKGAFDENAHAQLYHSESLYPWIAYAWHGVTQSLLYGIVEKKIFTADTWRNEQTWSQSEKRSSYGVLQEFFWRYLYVVFQGEQLYFRCNDFWRDRKETRLALYGELYAIRSIEVPIFVGWAKQTYTFSRIRMQRSPWQRSHPSLVMPKGESRVGSVGIRWNLFPFWWIQGEVRSTYDSMVQRQSIAIQLSLAGSMGRALEKRELRDKLFDPFSYSF